jgi:hypothetical protein
MRLLCRLCAMVVLPLLAGNLLLAPAALVAAWHAGPWWGAGALLAADALLLAVGLMALADLWTAGRDDGEERP